MIDLRSDTVTKPSPGMLRAMVEAEVGDDVFGEDPTVKRLERRTADLLGKEAALFVPSGVMANQLAIMVQARPGDEIILAERSHIFHYESGAPGLLAGVQLRPIGDHTGVLAAEEIEAAVRPEYDWEPRTSLICVENTINKSGGRAYRRDQLQAVIAVARRHGLRTHLDGARLWNAAVALDTPERVLAEGFDTVSVALSKGLGAPIGSLLAGSAADMSQARRYRKLLGGGMRQVGLLAAAGLYALEHHREGLVDDHRRARRLAQAMAEARTLRVDLEAVVTNIVIAEVESEPSAGVVDRLHGEGVLVVPFGPSTIRAVTHRDVGDAEIERALVAIQRVC